MEQTFKIDKKSVEKLVGITQLVDELQVGGKKNVEILYTIMKLTQDIVNSFNELNNEPSGIVVDNTKED